MRGMREGCERDARGMREGREGGGGVREKEQGKSYRISAGKVFPSSWLPNFALHSATVNYLATKDRWQFQKKNYMKIFIYLLLL